MGDDMELSKIYPGKLGHDVFVIKENSISECFSVPP
jgi:hypothetical protein